MLLFKIVKKRKERIVLLFNLSSELSNNWVLWWRTWAPVVSFSLSLNALCHGGVAILSPSLFLCLPLCPSYVLAWQCNCSVLHRFSGRYLWDPSTWERTSAWLPTFPWLISIMHTPAIPSTVSPPLSLPLSIVKQNIFLSFSSALLHFCYTNKGTFLNLPPWWWLTANWGISCINSSKATLKIIPCCLINRLCLHRVSSIYTRH